MTAAHQWCTMECMCPQQQVHQHIQRYTHGSQQEDSYQQIIPGIPQGSLYPTLSSLSSKVITPQEAQTLHNKV